MKDDSFRCMSMKTSRTWQKLLKINRNANPLTSHHSETQTFMSVLVMEQKSRVDTDLKDDSVPVLMTVKTGEIWRKQREREGNI